MPVGDPRAVRQSPAFIPQIKGGYGFYNEFLDIVVDGQRQERPVSPFSRR
ncbi:MAG: hypothetical protein M3070_01255 [Actinomycetota bacterium]|nr:hypothetical protein [Actinomycetota bacterium]